MKTLRAYVTLVHAEPPTTVYEILEEAGRTCYQSERLPGDTAEKFVSRIIERGHYSILEHISVTLKIICDRGVSHELVRHRIASYSQESTRYCNYSSGKFGEEVSYIDIREGIKLDPKMKNLEGDQIQGILSEWLRACEDSEFHYLRLLEMGASPQIARSVLNNSTKTTIMVTQNLRSWRHFIEMRYLGVAGDPHPQMKEISSKVFQALYEQYPIIFEDLKPENP